MSGPRSMLVIGPSWVGDMVMAQALFKTLKAEYPQTVIDVVAPSWSLPILERMQEVRDGIALPVGHGALGLAHRWQIGRALRPHHYHQAIILPRSFKSALIPWFAGAKHRTGYRGEMRYGLLNDIRPLDKGVLTQTVARYVALGLPATTPLPPPIPFPTLRVDAARQQQLISDLGLVQGEHTIAIMPGAEYGPAKQWPTEYYAELVARIGAEGGQCWVFGSTRDHPVAEAICHGAGTAAVNLCGRTSLVDVIDLLALCDGAVSNDSGLMHVAAAVGIPLVAIYGSSTPDYTPPLTERATVIYQGLACSPCFKRVCPLGHTNCLQGISPSQVLGALSSLRSTI